MDLQVTKKAVRNITETPVLQQSFLWSRIKRKQGILSRAFDICVQSSDLHQRSHNRTQLTDDVLIFIQKNGKDSIAYIPYGPTLGISEENQGRFLEELSESLRSYLPPECILLRYDLRWESPWAKDGTRFDEAGTWMGPPPAGSQEIRLNYNTRKWNLKKANTDILPADTVFIDLKKTTDTLLGEMKPKTRYNIGLARKKGVRVREGGRDDLAVWYRLYRETCARKGIVLHDASCFSTVLDTCRGETGSPGAAEMLVAEYCDKPLAAMFIAYSAGRATYLYGASSSSGREYMASYALQWAAMIRAQNRGCSEYDMFGVSPRPDPSHPLFGLYRFKTGFGGRLFHRMGCWDYPLNRSRYEHYLTSELKSGGYHLS